MRIENNVFSALHILTNNKHNGIKEPILWQESQHMKSVNKDEFLVSNIFDAQGNRIEKDQERPSHIYNDKGEFIFCELDPADRYYVIYADDGNSIKSVDQRTWFNETNKKAIADGSNRLEFPRIDQIDDKTLIREMLEDLKSNAKELIKNGKTPVIYIAQGHLEEYKKFLECVDGYGDDELKAMFDDELIKMSPVIGFSIANIRDVAPAIDMCKKDTFKNILKSIESEFDGKIDSEKFEEIWLQKIYGRAATDATRLSRKDIECFLENGDEYGYAFPHEYFDGRINRNISKNILDYVTDFYKENGLSSEDFYEKIKSAINKGLDEEKSNVLRVTNLYKDKGLNPEEFYIKINSAVARGFDEKYLIAEEKANNLPANLPPKRFRPNKSKDIIQYMRDIYKEKPQKPVDISIFNKEMDKWFGQLQYFINEDLEDLFISYGNNLKAN